MRSNVIREVAIALESGVEFEEIRKASGQGQDPDRTQGYPDAPRKPRISGFRNTELAIAGKRVNREQRDNESDTSGENVTSGARNVWLSSGVDLVTRVPSENVTVPHVHTPESASFN